MDKFNTKWLIFDKLKEPKKNKKKTETWGVISIKGNLLGYIKWYSGWRCYAFFPVEETIFNTECLQEIALFIYRLMKERA